MADATRRDFLKKSAVTTAAAGAALTVGAPAVHAKKTYNWKMVTTWPPNFPVFGESATMIAKLIEKMSDGRIKIQVYGGGELVPALQAFDAVSQGMVEMGHGCAYYWAGKAPAAQFFGAVPFGMNSQQMNSWLQEDGMSLWQELYGNFNLVPYCVGFCGVQMGGWFNREINSLKDIKGLKMRIPGLGGKVIAKAGGTAVLSAGGEIYTNLERGVIDATEWVGPYHDYKMGFYKVAKYYYYPGWHEPGTAIEMFVNKKALESLPKDLQQVVEAAALVSSNWMLAEFDAQNNQHLQKLIQDHKVQLKKFPKEVLQQLKTYSAEVISEVTAKDPMSKKVYGSYSKFQKMVTDWTKITEMAYLSEIG